MTAIAVATLLLFAQGPPLPEARNFAIGEQHAYLMLPPAFICGAEVDRFVWSADGPRLLVVRGSMGLTAKVAGEMLTGTQSTSGLNPSTELHAWDTRTQTSRKFWSAPAKEVMIGQVSWLEQTPIALAILQSNAPEANQASVVAIHSASGKVTELARVPGYLMLQLSFSPTRAAAAMLIGPTARAKPFQVRLITNDLRVSPPYDLPMTYHRLSWSADGSQLFASYGIGKGQPDPTVRFDSSRGAFVPVPPADPAIQKPESKPDLIVASMLGDIKVPIEVPKAPMVWLIPNAAKIQDIVPGMVTTDGAKGALSPAGDAVAYVHQGSAMVRQIVRLPKEVYLKAQAEAQKAEAMSRARQIGLALAMFSMDADGSFPENKAWADKVYPYVKNRSMLEGFNYTHAGGPVSNPSETSLGFLNGPGGRAVVYADGHVMWVPN